MARAFLLVLDSLGLGSTPDAGQFGDIGANTLGHVAQWMQTHRRPLHIPYLNALGLGAAYALVNRDLPAGLTHETRPRASYGAARERSAGKDTPSGHWEMTGVPVLKPFTIFPNEVPCFPVTYIDTWLRRAQLSAALGNCHASGTEIIARLGDNHMRTGYPIIYTSGDSVFQVAAHEQVMSLHRLYDICEIAFEVLHPLNIARVIARPFTGGGATAGGQYRRTSGRRDFAIAPPNPTLLDHARAHHCEVVAIGKISDIFAQRGITTSVKAHDNDAVLEAVIAEAARSDEQTLVFANFVDFDQNCGHRRDPEAYADALESFDRQLPRLFSALRAGDLVIICADHGCDPTWPGHDHTREHIPILCFGPDIAPRRLGVSDTFADIGQTIAHHLNLPQLACGAPLL